MGLIIEIAFIITLLLIILVNLGLLKLRKELKQVENKTKLSGMEIARILSSRFCEEEPHIIKKKGLFLDHYNNNRNVIKLSPEVFDGTDMYASLVAINTTLEANRNISKSNLFIPFIILVSYFLVIVGAFLNNINIINFGLVVFILAFILQLLISNIYRRKKELEHIYKLLEDKEIIKPFNEESKENLVISSLIVLARLPYGFINYFR